MKKLFLTIFTLLLLNISLNADTYTSNCPRWEAGGIVIYNGVQKNVPGTAPAAYCWDTVRIDGYGTYNGIIYTSETLSSSSSLANWYSGIRTQDTYYMYGEYYYGVYVYVDVLGYPQNVPTVKLNSTIGVLVSTTDIKSPSGAILNGKEYKFFIRKIPVSQAIYLSDLDVSGYIYVYDGANLITNATTTIK